MDGSYLAAGCTTSAQHLISLAREPGSSFPYVRLVVDVDGTEAADHRGQQCPDPEGPGLQAVHCTAQDSKNVNKGQGGGPARFQPLPPFTQALCGRQGAESDFPVVG